MTKDKALEMAIETLENAQKELDGQFSCGNCYTNVIQACKEALEQPAQEPKCNSHPDAPQYLHLYANDMAEPLFFWNKITPLKTDLTYQGKIKLEVDDD